MKHHEEQPELLDSLFQEKSVREFRDRLLNETLAAVRRKKRTRQLGAALVIAAMISLLMFPSRREQPVAPVSRLVPAARPFELVTTRPLPAATIVETRSGNLEAFSSVPNRFALVETPKNGTHLQILGDEELFALIPGEAKLLVWHAPHEAELLVLDLLTYSQ